MGCKICGRSNCMSSFHSLEEQEKHEKYNGMDNRELISDCIDKDNEIEDLTARVELLTHIYNAGYEAGHHDTVEAQFTPVHPLDMDSYQNDVVEELVDELLADNGL